VRLRLDLSTPHRPLGDTPKQDACHKQLHLCKEGIPADQYGCDYLIVQREQGHAANLCTSKVILGKGPGGMDIAFYRMQRVAQFYKHMASNFALASGIVKAVDPESRVENRRVYRKVFSKVAGLKNARSSTSV
jgi:hypothetical protein